MGASTGIVLTATAVSFSNEWIQTEAINWRILFGGLGTALVFDGIEKVSEPAAVGLSIMMLISVMFVPFNGNTPADTVLGFLGMAKAQAPPKVAANKTYGGQYSQQQING